MKEKKTKTKLDSKTFLIAKLEPLLIKESAHMYIFLNFGFPDFCCRLEPYTNTLRPTAITVKIVNVQTMN